MACPGGHVKDDESQTKAAIREVEEETGPRGVRLVEPPAPALPAGFPVTHSRVPLPWWITEMRVPADNHLAEDHVHVDHVWVGIASDPHPADQPAHPFGWYSAEEIQELPMFEDARLLAKVLFTCVADLSAENLGGAEIAASFATAGR